MKKILSLLLIISLLTACSSSNSGFTTVVDNQNGVLVEGNNISLTNQDIYEYLLESLGANYILDTALTKIADIKVTDQNAINTALEELKENYISILGSQEELETYATETLGYESYEAYEQQSMIPVVKQSILLEMYVSQNFEDLTTENTFVKIKVITFESEEIANEVYSSLLAGSIEFDAAFEEYNSNTSQTNVSLGVVSTLDSSSTYDSAILKLLPQLNYVGLYSVVLPLSDETSYAAIYVEEVDTSVLYDDIMAKLVTYSSIVTQMEVDYLAEYKFDVLEPSIKKQIQSLSGGYLQE